MGKRTYTHVKELENIIISMREAGMTRQEIADDLGLTKEQIKSWVTRYNHRNKKIVEGIALKPKGRPRKYPLAANRNMSMKLPDYGWKTSCCGIFCNP